MYSDVSVAFVNHALKFADVVGMIMKVFCFLKYVDTSVKSRICIGLIKHTTMWAGHLARPAVRQETLVPHSSM